MRGELCFAITAIRLDIMPLHVGGYTRNQQRKRMIVGNNLLWLKLHSLNKTRQHGDVGASTLANGGNSTWVPVPIASIVTTTQRVPVLDTTTQNTNTQTNMIPIASSAMASTTHMVPVTIASTIMATTQTVAPKPSPSLSSKSFCFPLHNVFYCISPDELPHSSPVLEVVSPIAHDRHAFYVSGAVASDIAGGVGEPHG